MVCNIVDFNITNITDLFNELCISDDKTNLLLIIFTRLAIFWLFYQLAWDYLYNTQTINYFGIILLIFIFAHIISIFIVIIKIPKYSDKNEGDQNWRILK